jgi:hypothetical protein
MSPQTTQLETRKMNAKQIAQTFWHPSNAVTLGRHEDVPEGVLIYSGSIASAATLVGLVEAGIEPNEIWMWDGLGFPDAIDEWLESRCYHPVIVQDWVLPPFSLCHSWGWDRDEQVKRVEAAGFPIETIRQGSRGFVLSLFDYTGAWSQPWADAGYEVITVDVKDADRDCHLAVDLSSQAWFDQVQDWILEVGIEVDVILAACPCTHFASSGARHFAGKDADGRTDAMVQLVHDTLAVIEFCQPLCWAIENPVGRIASLIPDLGTPWYWQPCHFGHPYTKKTGLWGAFNRDLPTTPVEPTEGSKMWSKYGGSSEATKAARSETPTGFAQAFFAANAA